MFIVQRKTWAWMIVLLAACSSPDEKAARFYQKGMEYLEAGNDSGARLEFNNALQINPKMADAFSALAKLDEKTKNWKGVYSNMQQVLAIDPNRLEARQKLGQLYLAGGEIDKALDEAETILKLQPADPTAIALRSAVYVSKGRVEEAIQELRGLLAKDQGNIEATAVLAAALLKNMQYAEALKTLDQGLKQHPGDVNLAMLKIRILAQNKDDVGVIEEFRLLGEQHPEIQELPLDLAQYLLSRNRHQDALTVLAETIAHPPESKDFRLKLAGLLEKIDRDEAEKLLRRFSQESPQEYAYSFAVAQSYLSRKQLPEAKEVLAKIVKQDETGQEAIKAKNRLAAIALDEKDAALAEKLIGEVLGVDSANPETLMLRAALRISQNRADDAIADLRLVLRDQPDMDQALAMMGTANLQKGVPELAETNFRKALEINPGNLAAALPVARRLLSRNELDRAEELLQKALRAHPGSEQLMALMANVKMRKKDWSGASSIADTLGKTPGQVRNAQLLSATLSARQGRHEEAVQKFLDILKDNPESNDALNGLAQSYEALGQRQKLIGYLKKQIEAHPSFNPAYNVLAIAYRLDKNPAEAEATVKKALQVDSKAIASYRLLAGFYLADGNPDKAGETYAQGLLENPGDPVLLLDQAMQFERTNQIDQAIANYKAILEKHPQHTVAANNLAALLADYRSDRESHEYALRLAGKFENATEPVFLDTYGWVNLKLGNGDKAIAALKKAVDLSPKMAVLHYHLGEAYYQNSKLTSAKTELETALKLIKSDNDFYGVARARQLLADIQGKS